mgnify:CR=1 FL=1
MDVLILGGSSLGRALAAALAEAGLDVTTSLAGRTKTPRALPGEVRIGGFGGAEALSAWLGEQHPGCVVNAVHSFATAISEHASTACAATGTPLARLVSPSWHELASSEQWIWVPDHDAAAAAVRTLPDPVLLTVGRQATAHYLGLGTRDITHRVIDAPAQQLPDSWRLLRARGPYTLAGERELMDAPGHRIATLVTKDSGGIRPDPKIQLAQQLGAHVVIVERPPQTSQVPVLGDVDSAVHWIQETLGSR